MECGAAHLKLVTFLTFLESLFSTMESSPRADRKRATHSTDLGVEGKAFIIKGEELPGSSTSSGRSSSCFLKGQQPLLSTCRLLQRKRMSERQRVSCPVLMGGLKVASQGREDHPPFARSTSELKTKAHEQREIAWGSGWKNQGDDI